MPPNFPGRKGPGEGGALHRALLLIALLLAALAARAEAASPESGAAPAGAPGDAATPDYRTPRAGEALDTEVFGREVHLPARSRCDTLALTLGTAIFSPAIGEDNLAPFAALYYGHHWMEDRRRVRGIFAGVVNYVDFEDGTWNDGGLEALAHWENFTVPRPTAEIVEGRAVEFSEIFWGHLLLGGGIGWRLPVPPRHCDNDLRVQLRYETGYLYSRRSEHTGSDVVLPPDTFFHQGTLRLRYDGFERNILELPHRGLAFGSDLTLGHRDRWSDHQFSPTIAFRREDTRNYLRLTSYAIAAFGIPFLSERHRLILSLHGGYSPPDNWDRFSAFRLGGGVAPSESNDLSRHPYPGASFDQFVAEAYAIGTVEYRVELLFFLYLHLRATFASARLAGLDSKGRLDVRDRTGHTFSIGLTSGFLFNSMLYLEYAYDNGVVRQVSDGHAILIDWSIAF